MYVTLDWPSLLTTSLAIIQDQTLRPQANRNTDKLQGHTDAKIKKRNLGSGCSQEVAAAAAAASRRNPTSMKPTLMCLRLAKPMLRGLERKKKTQKRLQCRKPMLTCVKPILRRSSFSKPLLLALMCIERISKFQSHHQATIGRCARMRAPCGGTMRAPRADDTWETVTEFRSARCIKTELARLL